MKIPGAGDSGGFHRVNLNSVRLRSVCAHAGDGLIGFARITAAGLLSSACNFIDIAEIPPGSSIGRHTHAPDEEEFYLVLQGTGRLWMNGEETSIEAGDLVRNPPSGSHGLVNTGTIPIRLFVFELRVQR